MDSKEAMEENIEETLVHIQEKMHSKEVTVVQFEEN
jgi:hypothetical protein